MGKEMGELHGDRSIPRPTLIHGRIGVKIFVQDKCHGYLPYLILTYMDLTFRQTPR